MILQTEFRNTYYYASLLQILQYISMAEVVGVVCGSEFSNSVWMSSAKDSNRKW